jgi:hypothetical protein
VEAVKAIHAEVLNAHGGSGGLRDDALLESAVAAPQATMMGVPVFAEPVEIASACLFYLCRNHPFIDGKKTNRTGNVSCFLERERFVAGRIFGPGLLGSPNLGCRRQPLRSRANNTTAAGSFVEGFAEK